jgi:4-hydroxymandelate oxidase
VLDLAWLERRARERLDRSAYDYFAGGADDELTLADNPAAWARLRLRPHVLRDVGEVSTSTTVLGAPVSLPVLVGPVAYQRLAHPDGELATALGAAAAGTLLVVSTQATASLEEIAAVAPAAPRWFQLYVYRDRRIAAGLVRRAAASGYRAVVLTVDVPVPGNRERDRRNRFQLPPGMGLANLTVPEERVDVVGVARHFDPTVTPEVIGWLAEESGLPVVVKGVLRGDDATACLEAGAAGIVVSNHGGRQLDGAVATAQVLREVCDAVGDRAEVILDGGVRRGTDVVKALALGARACMIGRPMLYGLGAAGQAGVERAIEILKAEIDRALALLST